MSKNKLKRRSESSSPPPGGKGNPTAKDPFAGLKQKLGLGPIRAARTVVEPKGAAKMSEILEDFVEPFHGSADTKEEYHKLLMLGVAAWNAALLPPARQEEAVRELLAATFRKADAGSQAAAQELVEALVARKRKRFARYRRAIVGFELVETGAGLNLQVASTVEDLPPK